jgi:CheY-like chemotaxis protein
MVVDIKSAADEYRSRRMVKRVLVVDDELDMRTFITTLLETNGFKTVSAQDGTHGLELAREVKPSLVILDIMMPRESGITMYRALKSDPGLKDTPVIMLSALSKKTFYHSQKILDEYKGEKIPEPSAYMEKPPEPEELLEVILEVLKLRSAS